jgi:hypothetical protein
LIGLGYRRRDTSRPGVVQDGLTKSVGISHRLEEQDVALNGTSPDMVHRFWRRRKNRRFMAGANCISLSTQTCRDETLGMLTSPSRFAQPLLVPSHEPHHIITKWEAAMEYRCNPELVRLINEQVGCGTSQRFGRQQTRYSVLSEAVPIWGAQATRRRERRS